jgi:hypothetical protein
LIDNAQSKELVEGLNFCVLVRFNVWAILNVPATLPPTSGLAVESASLANDLLVNTNNPSWEDAVTLSWTSTADEKLIVSGAGYAGGGGGSHAAFVQLTVDDTPIAPTESGTGAHLATSEIYAKNMSLTRHVAVAAGDHTAKVKVSKQSGYGSWTLYNGYTLEVYRFGA